MSNATHSKGGSCESRRAFVFGAAALAAGLALGACSQRSDTEGEGMERDRGGASGYGGDAGQVYAYDVEELEFKREGMRIAGRFFAPQGVARPCPTVIVCHGFGSSMERSADYAAAFARAGIAACVFDFIGGSWDSQSDGDMLHMSVLTEAADLNVVVDTLLARDDVDASRLVLMGGSQGGFCPGMTASDNDNALIFRHIRDRKPVSERSYHIYI